MTSSGQIANGQIVLDEPVRLPDGAIVEVEIIEPKVRITRPIRPQRLQKFQPITMPGDFLAEEIVRDRR